MVKIGFGVPKGFPSDREQCSILVSFSTRIVFYHQLRSKSFHGLIELFFGEHILNSLIFILKSGDWGWSSEQ